MAQIVFGAGCSHGPLLATEPKYAYQSGTSEVKNWIATMGITEGTGLEFGPIDHISCDRSEAGTGNAVIFSWWK